MNSHLCSYQLSSLVHSGAGGTDEGISIQYAFVFPGSDPHFQPYLPTLSSSFGIIARFECFQAYACARARRTNAPCVFHTPVIYPGHHRMIRGHPKYLCQVQEVVYPSFFTFITFISKRLYSVASCKSMDGHAPRLFARPVISYTVTPQECVIQQI